MTIGDQIKNERKPLKSNKVDELRRATISSRNINLVKPSRPDRKGLNSEIIIEQKLAEGKKKYRLNLSPIFQRIFFQINSQLKLKKKSKRNWKLNGPERQLLKL